jgi:signal transduction histidine kinase
VLVVDDDRDNRNLLEASLGTHGWDVVTASDGIEALEAARRDAFDICVSDILMPRMDGYRLIREWRADEGLCPIPFVFYTATYTTPEDEEYALSLGADGFIIKPKDPSEFFGILEPIVRLHTDGTVKRRACEPTADHREAIEGYSERLVKKLEDKLVQVEAANRELEAAIGLLSEEVEVKSRLIEEVGVASCGEGPAENPGLEELVADRTTELVELNERLRSAAEAKSAFIAGMGHKMRNHLNSIIGFSGILQQGLAGEMDTEQKRQVDHVYESGQALLALVNDVVDLSKMEAGQLGLDVAHFELLGALEDILASYSTTAQERAIRLRFDAPKGVIPMRNDRDKLEQVVGNLVSNALKFTPGGEVDVTAERSADGDSVIIRVADTGKGIAPDVLSRIFDEFVTYDPGGGSGGSGTGLGLALTRRLCELMGSSVSARSAPGGGSVFAVVLPVDVDGRLSEDGGDGS